MTDSVRRRPSAIQCATRHNFFANNDATMYVGMMAEYGDGVTRRREKTVRKTKHFFLRQFRFLVYIY